MYRCLILFLIVLAWSSEALGCDCRLSGSPEAEAARSAAVFVGEVIDVSSSDRPLGDGDEIVAPGHRLRFRVLDRIKPSGKGADQIELFTGWGGGDCGLVPREGSFFLIYAFHNPETDQLETSICTRSAPVLCAREDLRRLGRRNPSYLKEAMASEEMGSLPCVAKPRLRSKDDLSWPEAASPVQVKLTLTLDVSGNVLDVRIDEVLPEGEFNGFRQEVLQKVRRWRFHPATYQGRAVPVTTSWVLTRPEAKDHQKERKP